MKEQHHWPQIVHTWMFGESPVEDIVRWLAEAGADGLDLSVRLEGHSSVDTLVAKDVGGLVRDRGMKVHAITPIFMQKGMDLSHPDPNLRRQTIDFVKRCGELAAGVDCQNMLISPDNITVTHAVHTTYREDWYRAVESLRELAEAAGQWGVRLLIEPINRYRVSLVHTVADALQMRADAGSDAARSIGVVADTFHMHIEESRGIAEAIRQAGESLHCLHLGENNREVPGRGTIDWPAVLNALKDIGFTGPLSHEPVSVFFSEAAVAADETARNKFLADLREGISYMRTAMEQL